MQEYFELSETELNKVIKDYNNEYGLEKPENFLNILNNGKEIKEKGGKPKYFLLVDTNYGMTLMVIDDDELKYNGIKKMKEVFA